MKEAHVQFDSDALPALLASGGQRISERAYRQCGLAVAVMAAATALAACGGGATNSPRVASLGASTTTASGHGAASTTTPPKAGNATRMMDEWAACMRINGDPNQIDPTIDEYGVINVTMPDGISQVLSSQAHGTTGPCSHDELDAENVLRAGNPVAPPPTQAQLVQYVDCMRTNGVPNYPNAGPNGETDFRDAGVDPNSPSFVNADKICARRVNAPAWWIGGTGPPGDVVLTSARIGPNGPTRSPAPGDQPTPNTGNGGSASAG